MPAGRGGATRGPRRWPRHDPTHAITGLGLVGARERVQALRGSFQLKTAPGEGFTLSVIIPIEKAADDQA